MREDCITTITYGQHHYFKPAVMFPIVWKMSKQNNNNKSNARDTTNFTTKCLQTDMTSYVEVTHQQLMIY